jgi:hypothetical protein
MEAAGLFALGCFFTSSALLASSGGWFLLELIPVAVGILWVQSVMFQSVYWTGQTDCAEQIAKTFHDATVEQMLTHSPPEHLQ